MFFQGNSAKQTQWADDDVLHNEYQQILNSEICASMSAGLMFGGPMTLSMDLHPDGVGRWPPTQLFKNYQNYVTSVWTNATPIRHLTICCFKHCLTILLGPKRSHILPTFSHFVLGWSTLKQVKSTCSMIFGWLKWLHRQLLFHLPVFLFHLSTAWAASVAVKAREGVPGSWPSPERSQYNFYNVSGYNFENI